MFARFFYSFSLDSGMLKRTVARTSHTDPQVERYRTCNCGRADPFEIFPEYLSRPCTVCNNDVHGEKRRTTTALAVSPDIRLRILYIFYTRENEEAGNVRFGTMITIKVSSFSFLVGVLNRQIATLKLVA